MTKTAFVAVIAGAILFVAHPFAAIQAASPTIAEKAPDVWAPFRYFVGSWQGQGDGQNGTFKGRMSFQFIFRDRFLQAKDEARFDPREKNPGHTHEDLGVFSYDPARTCYVFRQFNAEGYVIEYVCKKILDGGKTFIFVADRVENMPPGVKVRVRYKISNPNEFERTIERALPGADYERISSGVLKRVR